MTLTEIKEAVKAGKTVCWSSDIYEVKCDKRAGWLIKCTSNNHCIGLTHQDGKTMNGKPEDFYIKQ